MEEVRINKYLSEAGVCSRREADRLLEEGRIMVDGKKAVMGLKVSDANVIAVDGKKIAHKEKPVLLAVYKPVGVVCTAAEEEKNNIVTYVGYPDRIYPIGRLDKNSEGLILMTNQGELAEKIGHARGLHEKEYIVRVNKPVTAEFLEAMAAGVRILHTKTRPCRVEKLGARRFRIILTQGLNRQIRRMCEALGYEVQELCRVRIMNITLDGLHLGEYRRIEGQEMADLLAMLENTPERRTDG